MKLLYLAILGNYNSAQTSGIRKKIFDQVNAMHQLGHICELKLFVTDMENTVDKKDRLYPYTLVGVKNNNKLKRRKSIMEKYLFYIKEQDYDLVYMRYPLADYWFYRTLQKGKKNNKAIFVAEHQSIEHVELLADINLNKLAKYILEILFKTIVNKYFDIQVAVTNEIGENINSFYKGFIYVMGNGISYKKTYYRKKWNNQDSIKLVYIGNVASWSGLDDLIINLNKYNFIYNKKVITLDIVGDGVFLQYLKNLVNKLHVENYVIFHGYLTGENKINVLENSDFGIGSLASLRRHIKEGSNLKLREYCLLGLPFCKSDYDIDFIENNEINNFVFDINQEKTLESQLDGLLEMALKSKGNREISLKMHKYAQSKLDWEIKMKNLFLFIDNHR